MVIEFSNVVRVLAAADQQTIIQFCEESGTVDSILGFKDACNGGDSVIFARFKRFSSVLDLNRRSKTTKLGGRSVLVDSLADSPILQEQCKTICRPFFTPTRTPCMPYLTRCLSERGDRLRSSPNRPSSAPAGKRNTTGLGFALNGDRSVGLFRSGLSVRQTATSRPFNYRGTSDDSMTTTIGGLPSPLAKSPTILGTSVRSNVLRTSRASTVSPSFRRSLVTTSRRSQSFLLGRPYSFTTRTESGAVLNTADEIEKNYLRSDMASIRRELDEAKENYARSLEKVKDHLTLMEKRYNIL